jgi:hypothetical protein
VGDRVRISKAKRTFEKGYLPNWTTELFTISRKVPGRNAYCIEDDHGEELEGTFYAKELQQVVKTDKCLRSGIKQDYGDIPGAVIVSIDMEDSGNEDVARDDQPRKEKSKEQRGRVIQKEQAYSKRNDLQAKSSLSKKK